MKNLIVLTICVALFGTGLFAQRDSLVLKKPVHVGMFGAATVQFPQIKNTDNMTTFGGGLALVVDNAFVGVYASQGEAIIRHGVSENSRYYLEMPQRGFWLGGTFGDLNRGVRPKISIKVSFSDLQLWDYQDNVLNDEAPLFEDDIRILQLEAGIEFKINRLARLDVTLFGANVNNLSPNDYIEGKNLNNFGVSIALSVGYFNN